MSGIAQQRPRPKWQCVWLEGTTPRTAIIAAIARGAESTGKVVASRHR